MEVIKHLAHLHAYLLIPTIKEKWIREFTTLDEMWAESFNNEFTSALFEQIKDG